MCSLVYSLCGLETTMNSVSLNRQFTFMITTLVHNSKHHLFVGVCVRVHTSGGLRLFEGQGLKKGTSMQTVIYL